jgi:nucleoid-associated protein YgaU
MRYPILIAAAIFGLIFVLRHSNAGRAPAAPAPPAGGGSEREYRVRSGDTLWGIAKRYLPSGSSAGMIQRYVAQIAAANQIANPNLIFPDQRLVIPVYA